jgi:hypothetical protein
MRRKAEKNHDGAGTKQSSTSFISFSDSRIHSSLGRVGISMCRYVDKISISANVLRHLERDRLTDVPKVSTGIETPILEEDEADVISDGQILTALVGSISEVDLEQSELSSLYDLKASGRSSKSSAGKSSRRNAKANKSKIISR